ncbi:hypothetical protein PR202_ga29503 [Eleusine coracana subsp. coracana]|uniref:Remorin C-terminal domain-containing protein n=1 Tax=Eleusine coracana subsp. coracana TaxID=191504 RepID=A0AAV5DMH1_ELECO|nr:hypothetical protein PR202_ga29503 [Eleusine coracana subsp. coracana]
MLSEQTTASGSSSRVVEHERSVDESQERRPHPHPDNDEEEEEEEPEFRDIHPVSSPASQPSSYRSRGRGESWGSAAGSRHTSIRSVGSDTAPSEPFQTMSREFSAMVAAANARSEEAEMGRIGEEEREEEEETNPLAIVPDSNPIPSPRRRGPPSPAAAHAGDVVLAGGAGGHGDGVSSVGQVKKEEVESKIAAWQVAETAKVNNRFKREEVVINGWEGDQVEKASAWLKKYERKLEEKRAKAMEKAQNEVAKARRKAEEKRASAEAKRGTKVARVLELANFMRAVGRAPSNKRSFF